MSTQVGAAKLQQIERGETFDAARKREYDCLSCRVMGATAFAGLGIYSYISGHRDLTKRQADIMRSGTKIGMPARRLGVSFTSAVLVGLGLYRAFV
ncbi:hypothetical protein KVT40_006948 [Elsinoe batatas]|uniref:Distal membrane-arm assembly complex protein 1-like domain-containing protein n=1 Tax=Elsinoe batatas TaxID=2601811 RepID=A0A8K0KX83_9PEZI|nr:hypothetical protein KVT40_006948 [Elsinoe batatas]